MITIETPPGTKPIAAQCKLCRKPMTIFLPTETPDSIARKLLPMATCDDCYGQQDRLLRSREKTEAVCGLVSRLKLMAALRIGDVAQQERLDNQRALLRERLTKACYGYVCALAEKHGLVWTQPVNEIVDMIMDNPCKAKEAFALANNYVRQVAQGKP